MPAPTGSGLTKAPSANGDGFSTGRLHLHFESGKAVAVLAEAAALARGGCGDAGELLAEKGEAVGVSVPAGERFRTDGGG
jgi:hypothetical protein